MGGGADQKLLETIVLAPEMGQGVMPNAVGENRVISFLKLSGNRILLVKSACELGSEVVVEQQWRHWVTLLFG